MKCEAKLVCLRETKSVASQEWQHTKMFSLCIVGRGLTAEADKPRPCPWLSLRDQEYHKRGSFPKAAAGYGERWAIFPPLYLLVHI